MKRLSKSWLRILSGLFTNLAAAALAVIIITPNFIPIDSTIKVWALTYDITLGIVLLVVAVKLDEAIKYE